MKGGFILLKKESGLSSNKIDNLIKKRLGFKKVGHLGTLDPLAEGLLIIMVDDATKYAKYFDDMDKVYEMNILFGATSKTLDSESEKENITDTCLLQCDEELTNILDSFKGSITQMPPLYSAIKVGGRPLYNYAIKSEEVEIKPRETYVYDIKALDTIKYERPFSYLLIKAHVKKGFYMRSLSRDIGAKLNVPSMAESIKRISEGQFDIKNSYSLDEILENRYSFINPIDYIQFKEYTINDNTLKRVLNGHPLSIDYIDEYLKIIYDNKPIAIYKYDNESNKYRMDLLIRDEN